MIGPTQPENGRTSRPASSLPPRLRRRRGGLGAFRRADGARRDMLADEGGATAVEFAMMMPLLCLLAFGSIAMGLGLWSWNVLEAVTAQTARCVAIKSTDCRTAPADCSGDGGTCFAVQLASERGLPHLESNQVIVDPIALVDGVSYTSVEIDYPFSLLGYSMTLTSRNRFPNPS